jgi:hypothetical protein
LQNINIEYRYATLIEKRYGRIDYHNETPATVVSDLAKANFHAAMHNGDKPMNTTLNLIDRFALAALAIISVAIMPLAAVGLMAGA